jgi:hypothetical protein
LRGSRSALSLAGLAVADDERPGGRDPGDREERESRDDAAPARR